MNPDSKLYISVLKNDGGSVTLNPILYAALFPHEYPIFGRFRIPKSKIGDILFNNSAPIYDFVMYEWIYLELLRDKNAKGLNWTKYMEYDDNFYKYFAFVDFNFDNSFYMYLESILRNNLNLRPDMVILITDSLCGSSCG